MRLNEEAIFLPLLGGIIICFAKKKTLKKETTLKKLVCTL